MIRIHSWRLGCAKPRRSGSGALLGNHRSFIIDSTGMKFGETRAQSATESLLLLEGARIWYNTLVFGT